MLLVLFKKFLGKRQSYHSLQDDSDPPEHKVIRIQQGDIRLRNQFIAEYQPYIAKITGQFCRRYIDPARDDEFSIALSAFNEAINQFSIESGRSFLSFAQTVVKRRLIDYVRKQQRHSGQIPLSAFEIEDDEQNLANPIEIHQAIEQYEKEKIMDERQAEISELNQQLSEFGISFFDLADSSPKHTDSRVMLFGIGKILAEQTDLMDILLNKKILPIKELLEHTEVSRKTLERNRKYLITIALINHGSYEYLKDYLHIDISTRERSGENE